MSDFILNDGTRLPVSVRVSNRAKRQMVRFAFTGDLEVVVPVFAVGRMGGTLTPKGQVTSIPVFDPGDRSPASVAGFLEQQRAWIERTAKRMSQQRMAFEASKQSGMPKQLEFPPCGDVWQVEYKPAQTPGKVHVHADGLRRVVDAQKVQAVCISGDVADEELCCRALVRFVALQAKEVLVPFAWGVCREIGAVPASIAVNNRKSAWGICKSNGDIRIDRRVMFLPRELARQVVLHELAHLKHMNHSSAFYDELYSYPGSTPALEKSVKQANQYIPAWFMRG